MDGILKKMKKLRITLEGTLSLFHQLLYLIQKADWLSQLVNLVCAVVDHLVEPPVVEVLVWVPSLDYLNCVLYHPLDVHSTIHKTCDYLPHLSRVALQVLKELLLPSVVEVVVNLSGARADRLRHLHPNSLPLLEREAVEL